MFYKCLLFSLAVSVVLAAKDQCLLLVLVDGVRRSYIEEETRYGFQQLRENGVEAEYLRPILPSNSYPNWYTIATGKYAESHGIVNNFMYDRERNEYFLGAPPSDAHWWNQTEPIWITAEKNDVRTAMYWWDGCQIQIDGILPTECVKYQHFIFWPTINKDVSRQMSSALKRIKEKEICLAMFYYEPVDGFGHISGPDSEKRKEVLRDIDKILNDLQTEIKELGLEEKLNLVVVSDHGMSSTSEKKEIDISEALDDNDIEVMLDMNFFSMLWTVKGKEDKVYNDLKNKKFDGLHVYKKEEMPEQYHFRNNKLIAPIILMTEKTHILLQYKNKEKMKPNIQIGTGIHGLDPYSPTANEMLTVFYARGPSFKKNYTATPMEMTDVYNVLCHALDFEPLPNNGSWDRVKDFLKD